MILFGVLILGLSAWWALHIYQTIREWEGRPETQGVVLESRISHKVVAPSSSRSRSYSYLYYLYVKYIYEHTGRFYVSEKFSQEEIRENTHRPLDLGEFNPSASLISKLKDYPPGSKVWVKYNPKKPEDSILEVRKDWKLYWGPLFIAGFALIFSYLGLVVSLASQPGIPPLYARTYFVIPVLISLFAIILGFLFILFLHRTLGIILILVSFLIAFGMFRKEYQNHKLKSEIPQVPQDRF
jgi:hypothetical protein